MTSLEDIIERETLKQHDARTIKPVYESDPKNVEKYVNKRIEEIREHETFGSPEYEAMLPIIQELQKDSYRAVIIAVETRDGIRLMHRSCNSDKLTRELKEFLG